ncbi:hypothetical protein AYI69_g5715 [Smittium culicis]|uniref:CCHC-type domain-containing protein n=1 Tax=Smittium culicis TaxID=133412 RepID=A0A1R1Y407_9FUNG|nr:hypothetical protein AYI69_g5715 [Smittium culicis]
MSTVEQSSAQGIFEGLPEKFSGKETKTSTDSWCRKFLRIAHLKSWTDQRSIEIFKSWVDGEAEEWVYEQEQLTELTNSWKIDDWLSALKKKYPFSIPKERKNILTTKSLERLTIKEDESIHDYNNRFKATLFQIPEEWYTDSLIKRIYCGFMIKHNESLAWSIMELPKFTDFTSAKLMKEFKNRHAKRDIFYNKDEIMDKIKEKPIKAKAIEDKEVIELTRMIKDLTLLVKSSVNNREDKSYLHCFNCDGRGHRTRECKKPRNEELFKKLSTEYYKNKEKMELKNDPNQTLLLATEDEISFAATNKRMRLDNLVEPSTIPNSTGSSSFLPIQTLNHKQKNKAKKKIQIHKEPSSSIPSRILDAPAPITNRELFSIYPKALDDTVNNWKHIKSKNKHKTLLTEENDNLKVFFQTVVPINKDKPRPLSYILAKILGHDVSLFVDIGSTSCVVSAEVVEKLGIGMEKANSKITAVGGDTIDVLGITMIPLTFENRTIIFVNLLMLR